MNKVKKIEGYELIDTSNKEKLERFGDYLIIRPDPQIIWRTQRTSKLWSKSDAKYIRSNRGGGEWRYKKEIKESILKYKSLKFKVKPTNFKHMGIFPEQAVNWEFIMNKIKEANKEVKLLNLFAYTGGATLAAASAGAKVCHVDASKGMVSWAKENASLSNLQNSNIRYIVDDCEKFIKREIRRNSKYDAIVLDPPSYGRGPYKELWKLEDKIYDFLINLKELLSDKPLFIILNTYANEFSAATVEALLKTTLSDKFKTINSNEIGIREKEKGIILPCGNTAYGYN